MKTKLALSLLAGLLLASCASSPSTSAPNIRPYPLDTCIVSDNDLGSMGPVISKVHNGQEVKFCCKPCVRKFEANQEKFLAKLR